MFPQYFHTRKLGEISVFWAVLLTLYLYSGPNQSLSEFVYVWEDFQKLSDIWFSEFWVTALHKKSSFPLKISSVNL